MAKKVRQNFVCTECGYNAVKWEGKCPACHSWNTLVEFKEAKLKPSGKIIENISSLTSNKLHTIEAATYERTQTGDQELDRVLGGGIVPGSVVLLGGQPGIGKSTLILQTVLQAAMPVLYVSGEESESQIKMRADRLGGDQAHCDLLCSTSVERIVDIAKEIKPKLLVIDSIQTLHVSDQDHIPGSISQIKASTQKLIQLAKTAHIPILMIGHINKDGQLAGPKLLEHMVDVVLQFDGATEYNFRMLRSIKNRYGSTDEIGVYQMSGQGLQVVDNPSAILMSSSSDDASGCAIAMTIQGKRALLIEVQALVTPTAYSTPQRSATGFDLRRLTMLLAVLEKKGGKSFGFSDVFLNVVGGLKIQDPAVDLAVVVALLSSLEEVIIPRSACFAGEVGLTGEIRPVFLLEQRLMEADRLGMTDAYVSQGSEIIKPLDRLTVHSMERIHQLLETLF